MLNDQRRMQLAFGAVLLAAGSISASAQRSGTAEPLRIEFKRGTNSTALSGTVRGSEEAEYVLAARQGQQIIVKLTSMPRRSSCFELRGPDQPYGAPVDCYYDYSGTLPKTGDYLIFVVRTATARETSAYKLSVSVR